MNNGSDGATVARCGCPEALARRRARLSLDDVRRAGSAGGAVRAADPVPARLGGRAHAGGRRDDARGDVDAERIAVIGVSQAGYWVPRALAFEHRFAAAVADPGVVDVSTSWTAPLPRSMLRRSSTIRATRASFDKEMRLEPSASRSRLARRSDFRGEPYGITSGSRFDLYQDGAQAPPRRRGGGHHHAAADHRARGRAVLAGAVTAAATTGSPGPKELVQLHGRRGRQPPLRADGARRCATRGSSTGWRTVCAEGSGGAHQRPARVPLPEGVRPTQASDRDR